MNMDAYSILYCLRVCKEVITSHSKKHCKGSNLNGNQSEALKEMTDFISVLHLNKKEKFTLRVTKI